jgi:hypothetical protein
MQEVPITDNCDVRVHTEYSVEECPKSAKRRNTLPELTGN